MREVIYLERDAQGVEVASWQPAGSDRRTQVHVLIPMQVGERPGMMELHFKTAKGLDSFVIALQAEREATFGAYEHMPAMCTHCRQEIPRHEPEAIREHTMTCEKNPLVAEARDLRGVMKHQGEQVLELERELRNAKPTEDERQIIRWVRELVQQSPTAQADIRYGAALELLQRLLSLRPNHGA